MTTTSLCHLLETPPLSFRRFVLFLLLSYINFNFFVKFKFFYAFNYFYFSVVIYLFSFSFCYSYVWQLSLFCWQPMIALSYFLTKIACLCISVHCVLSILYRVGKNFQKAPSWPFFSLEFYRAIESGKHDTSWQWY